MMTNINETVESYFEGSVGVFDCFVSLFSIRYRATASIRPSFKYLHPNPYRPHKQLAKEHYSLLMFPNWLALKM